MLYHPVKNLSEKTIPGIAESTIFLKNKVSAEMDSTKRTIDQLERAKQTADSLQVLKDKYSN